MNKDKTNRNMSDKEERDSVKHYKSKKHLVNKEEIIDEIEEELDDDVLYFLERHMK